MPTREGFQRLVEWCDTEPPFSWLKSVAGVSLAVHSVVPIGTPSPRATAFWTGDLALRKVSGISFQRSRSTLAGRWWERGTLLGSRS
jgi:hypothetical protein